VQCRGTGTVRQADDGPSVRYGLPVADTARFAARERGKPSASDPECIRGPRSPTITRLLS